MPEIIDNLIENITISDIVVSVSAVVAVISAIIAWIKRNKASKSEKQTKKYHEETLKYRDEIKSYYQKGTERHDLEIGMLREGQRFKCEKELVNEWIKTNTNYGYFSARNVITGLEGSISDTRIITILLELEKDGLIKEAGANGLDFQNSYLYKWTLFDIYDSNVKN